MDKLDNYLKKVFYEAVKIMPELEYDDMSGGTWSMVMSAARIMYCTPFYEGSENISLAVLDVEGNTIDLDELPYRLTKYPEIDALEFVKQIKIYLLNKRK